MSSFLVLRASSSRRTLTALPSLDHAPNPRPLRRNRGINQSSLQFRNPLPSHRQFSTSRPWRAEDAYDKRKKEYDAASRHTTAEKRRKQELLAIRAGREYPIMNPFTYAPFKYDSTLLDPRLWPNMWRHRKHRKYRDSISFGSGTLAEKYEYLRPSGKMAKLPEVTPIFHNDEKRAEAFRELSDKAILAWGPRIQKAFTWFWRQSWKYLLLFRNPSLLRYRIWEDAARRSMNRGLSAEAQLTTRAAANWKNRYPDELENLSALWRRFNVAQARRLTSVVNSTSRAPAHRNAHILMSSNRVVDWEMVKQYAPPHLLWIRAVPPNNQMEAKHDDTGRGLVQICVQFDTEQRITFVEPETRKGEPQSYLRRSSESDESWRIGQYRQDLTRERYERALAKKQEVPADVLLPEGTRILSLDATKGLPRHTTSSRVVDNVVFQFDTLDIDSTSNPTAWRILDRIQTTPPHYMMDPEKWEEVQREFVKKDEQLGNAGAQQVHHVRQSKWVEMQRRKEKAGEVVEEKKEQDPIKAREAQAQKRIKAWQRADVQDRRERALLAMNPTPELEKEYKKRQVIARNQAKDLFSHFDREEKTAAVVKKSTESEEKSWLGKTVDAWTPGFLRGRASSAA